VNEHSLPDDVRRWPDEPAQVLGVPEDVDRKTLRRAYSRLVRRFKPEHFPEQFQKVRTAYDALLQMCEWRELYGTDEELDGSPDAEPADAENAAPAAAAIPLPPDPTDELWDAAADGRLGDAYRGYRELHNRTPAKEDIALRLYWLLRFNPQLDEARAPADWLYDAMQQAGSGTAIGLYDDELTEEPALVNSPRATRLLEAPVPTWMLAQLAVTHVRAAAKLKRWDAIRHCLDAARPRIADEDSAVWVRVLVSALDEVAWSPNVLAIKLEQEIRSELERCEHLQLALTYDFDRVDLLRDLAEECLENRGMYGIPRDVLQFLSRTWNKSGFEVRPDLQKILEPWIAEPDLGLAVLDRMQTGSPAALGRLVELVESSGYDNTEFDGSEPAIEALKRRLRSLLASVNWDSYEPSRRMLRNFCLTEGIALGLIEQLLAADPEYFATCHLREDFLHDLARDLALDCLLKAHLVFWE
jgi:hypothetical protein